MGLHNEKWTLFKMFQGKIVHAVCDKRIYDGYQSMKCETMHHIFGSPQWSELSGWNSGSCVRKVIEKEKGKVCVNYYFQSVSE